MSDPAYSVILVYSTSRALRGERLLLRAGIPCKLIPVPRHLSSDCGSCLRIAATDRERAGEVLAAGGVDIEGLHDLS